MTDMTVMKIHPVVIKDKYFPWSRRLIISQLHAKTKTIAYLHRKKIARFGMTDILVQLSTPPAVL